MVPKKHVDPDVHAAPFAHDPVLLVPVGHVPVSTKPFKCKIIPRGWRRQVTEAAHVVNASIAVGWTYALS